MLARGVSDTAGSVEDIVPFKLSQLASTETFMGLSTMDNADLLDSEKCGEKGID